jgi:predicted RNA-binding Zn-ribbon protein involved in translation (DUF1610 family)
MKERQFPCQNCGADMAYEPGTVAMNCPYCSTENEISDSDDVVSELDYYEALERAMSAQEIVEQEASFKCSGCAAESAFDARITATQCPFCGTSMVKSDTPRKLIRPRSLLPFVVEDEKARSLRDSWLSGLWFAPGDLKKRAREADSLSGIYVPYWTYDSETDSRYTGQRGEHYWVTNTYTTRQNGKTVTRTRRVRKTRWYSASGRVHNRFDDVLILASESLPHKITEKLEPWDLENLVPYDERFIGGFLAESYQVDLDDGFSLAQEIMDAAIRSSIRSDIGGDEQRIHSVNTHYDDITFKHVLLPIWVSAYRYRKKVYRFVVNGRSGEVQGQRPWSFWKISGLALALALIIAAVTYFVTESQRTRSHGMHHERHFQELEAPRRP